jgi:hypothetical protein
LASNARIIADGGGGGGGGGGGEYAGTREDSFHGLSVDNDGMLTYTKFDMIDKNTTLTISTDAGNSSWEGITYSFDNYNHTTGKPNSNTLYDQYKFSGRDQFYFIDDDGNLIVRFNEKYTHTEPK